MESRKFGLLGVAVLSEVHCTNEMMMFLFYQEYIFSGIRDNRLLHHFSVPLAKTMISYFCLVQYNLFCIGPRIE